MDKVISNLTQICTGKISLNNQVQEDFTGNINELLDNMIKMSIEYVGKSVARMTKYNKRKGLSYLLSKGFFY